MHYFAIGYSAKKRQWMSRKCGSKCRAEQVLLRELRLQQISLMAF